MSRPHDVTFMGGQKTVLDCVSVLANRTLNIVTIEEPPFVALLTNDYDRANLQPQDVEGMFISNCVHLIPLSGEGLYICHAKTTSSLASM